MNITTALVANIVAGFSLVVSAVLAVVYIRDRRHAVFAIENEYAKELLEWHEEVVGTLLELRISDQNKRPGEYECALSRLSALIEQGRVYFPNIDRGDGFGKDKPPAYRGYRNLALDLLVGSFNIYSESLTPELEKHVEILQRHFTSIVFEILRPQERLERIRTLTDRFFVLEKCYEDFLENQDAEVLDAIWR